MRARSTAPWKDDVHRPLVAKRAFSRSPGIDLASEPLQRTPLFMRRRPLRSLPTAMLVLIAAVAPSRLSAAAVRAITTAAEVRALSASVADTKLPVVLRGVVTAAEPDWLGKFVMQDETAGIFVQNTGLQPAIGDYLEVSGTTGPGWFAPVIQTAGWKKLGTAPLPIAKQVSIERLMAGVEASQRVEINGLVRSVSYVASQKTMVEVSIGGYRVRVYPKLPSRLNPRSLVAAKVRVRGTAATTFNAARRQLTAVSVMVPTVDDFIVEEAELHPPFEQPIVAINDLARFRTSANLGERLHVKGVVTFQRPGIDLFIQDETGGLHLETRQPLDLPLGREIEAVGFLEIVNYRPVLRDAILLDRGEPLNSVVAREIPMSELREGLHDAELIVVRGTLLDRSVRQVRREDPSFVGVRTICTIRNSEQSFTAEYEGAHESAAIRAAPLGSVVELRGVASFETGDDGKPKAVTVLLPHTNSFRVIESPSWFTPERSLIAFGVASALLAAVAGWLMTVSKKNAMLSFLVAEREKSQKELQLAHDQLEARVKERTEQLKLEMSVRKATEVEFRATLTERTRLARELHDTLEQALTGIALQLETALKLFERNPVDAGPPLDLARRFLRQSQLELRRSIWDLRSRELEQFDLAKALSISSSQLLAGSNISAQFDTIGEQRRLPEIVEENLLRIAQEALTNVVKHSGASAVSILLTFGREAVSLEIRDNGSGLLAERISARSEQHFGLLGMAERAKRIGGRLDVSGPAGEGTTIRVIVSLSGFNADAEQLAPSGSQSL